MIFVSNCLVTAVRAVNVVGMGMGFMFGARHVQYRIAYMRIQQCVEEYGPVRPPPACWGQRLSSVLRHQ
ncbi:hypothetical protein HNP40_003237 [Mycobacteroides chelonae]|nr:hypothetical protein [Mycobacteroides chelonae]